MGMRGFGSLTLFFSSLIFLSCLLTSSSMAGEMDIRYNNMRFNTDVKSFSELRWNKLSRQGWDISCGAAALSTLLTYHNNQPFSEMAITLTILKNSDPKLVRERGGFSLYDLKRFVKAVGFEGLGYGDMTLDDLELFNLPAILPIRIKEFDHFVIFRKRIGKHIFIGDPAFGNISFSEDKFLKMWKSKIAFYVVTPENKAMMDKQQRVVTISPLTPEAMELAIPNSSYVPRLIRRIPTIPMTRRAMINLP